jgi:hypothetical protein
LPPEPFVEMLPADTLPVTSSAVSVDSYIIRPSDFLYNLILKSNFYELEQYILNTLSSPIYTMSLQVPQENV